jgi:hypothetical protein
MSTGGLVASNNFSKTSFIREVVHGVTPATPAWQEIPLSRMASSSRRRAGAARISAQTARPAARSCSISRMRARSRSSSNSSIGIRFIESALRNRWVNKAVRDNNGVADSVITDVNSTGGVVTCTTGTAFAAGHLCSRAGSVRRRTITCYSCTTGSATVPAFNAQGLAERAGSAGGGAAARGRL